MTFYDVLVVGGGFGGALGARHLERRLAGRPERIVMVAQENFMLFSPLLPEAASGTIEPRHAVIPLRELLGRTTLLVGEVTALDPGGGKATVTTVAGEVVDVEFARALVAPGSVPTIFPIPGLTEHAVGFKTLADAIWLRNRVLRQLDVAQATSDGEERRRHLTFTFVGGGYAGVEALAELESLARDAVVRYQGLGIGDFRWVLVEARETLLPGLHPKLAVFTERILRDRGVDLYLGTRLQSCLDKMVVLSDGVTPPYPSETIVWTAGQRPNPDVDDFGLPTDESGRVLVDAGMEVEGLPGVFVIGDAARAPVPEGGFAPMTAQHAVREAKVAAINISASLGIGKRTTLTYRNRGLAVTLGKWQGTAQVRRLTFTGPLAWWMGRSYHLLMIPGLARKARVVSDWTISLLFRRDVSQLGQLGSPTPLEPADPESGNR